jgi:hypothetical protein
VEPVSKAKKTIDYVHRILKEKRDIVIDSHPLEATAFEVEHLRMAYVFYESGLSINVMYDLDDPKKRAARGPSFAGASGRSGSQASERCRSITARFGGPPPWRARCGSRR